MSKNPLKKTLFLKKSLYSTPGKKIVLSRKSIKPLETTSCFDVDMPIAAFTTMYPQKVDTLMASQHKFADNFVRSQSTLAGYQKKQDRLLSAPKHLRKKYGNVPTPPTLKLNSNSVFRTIDYS